MSIITDHPVVPINFLVHQASLAVKEGLDRDVALRALTVNPAQMMGLDDRVGALRPGLDGDVVIWSGDPFSVYSRAERVFLDGALVYDRTDPSKQPVVELWRDRMSRLPLSLRPAMSGVISRMSVGSDQM